MNTANLSDGLLSIRNRFIESLPDRMGQMEEALSSWTWGTTCRPDDAIDTLYNLTHQLVGTAGSLGFTALSDLAKDLNLKLRDIQKKDNRVLTDPMLDEISRNFSALSAEAHRCISGDA